MRTVIFFSVYYFVASVSAEAREARFVSLDRAKRVWVVDVSGEAACPAAAALLARERKRRMEHVFPTRDGDFAYADGCIVTLK